MNRFPALRAAAFSTSPFEKRLIEGGEHIIFTIFQTRPQTQA